jgi:hypothetical protein
MTVVKLMALRAGLKGEERGNENPGEGVLIFLVTEWRLAINQFINISAFGTQEMAVR